jgi:hypothetical protein
MTPRVLIIAAALFAVGCAQGLCKDTPDGGSRCKGAVPEVSLGDDCTMAPYDRDDPVRGGAQNWACSSPDSGSAPTPLACRNRLDGGGAAYVWVPVEGCKPDAGPEFVCGLVNGGPGCWAD